MDGIRSILSVLPPNKPELHCTLLDRHVIDHFETAGRKLNKLTKNGWLSFWAMFAVENHDYCFKQLTYLDLNTDTDRNGWYKLTERKIYDHERERISRSVIRILLFGGPQCGKTVFCDRLLCRIPISPSTRRGMKPPHKSTQHFRAVSNRIGASNEYNFLAITEVPAIQQYIEQAMDNFLPAYDMILLMFDLNETRSFYELCKIFDRMPKNHSLPIQVLATKADLKQVQQFNLDTMEEEEPSYYHQQQQQQQHDQQQQQQEQESRYDIPSELNRMGLYEYAPTWLTHNDSCDFPQLFDDLFFIATNPHFRRLKKGNDKNKQEINWKTIIKRTITITISASIILYGTYRIYKWWYSSSSSSPNARSDHHIPRRHFRRSSKR